MTADTPTPYTPPDGVILTTMAEVRRIGHGQVSPDPRGIQWWSVEIPKWSPTSTIWWRPTPERTVTIELPESVARAIAWNGGGSAAKRIVLRDACRDACRALDGDT